ncbi:hypothetical protein [Klebsiella quasipneumoniae]|uniref:hypothetical protein n=1 Tax=Klebsiella quasipneumoniae TaxID=1463165 RepID=UPI00070CD48A|nr:hypothetical protein [Klebsiella quasipneumoniae]
MAAREIFHKGIKEFSQSMQGYSSEGAEMFLRGFIKGVHDTLNEPERSDFIKYQRELADYHFFQNMVDKLDGE